jgi:hypothetical protein
MKTKKLPPDYAGVEDQRRGWAGNLVEQFKNRKARKEKTMQVLKEKSKTKKQKDTEYIQSFNRDRQASTKAEVRAARKDASVALSKGRNVKIGKRSPK